jgi:hypothetical protein
MKGIIKKTYGFLKAFLSCDFDKCKVPKRLVDMKDEMRKESFSVHKKLKKIGDDSVSNINRVDRMIATVNGDTKWFLEISEKDAAERNKACSSLNGEVNGHR